MKKFLLILIIILGTAIIWWLFSNNSRRTITRPKKVTASSVSQQTNSAIVQPLPKQPLPPQSVGLPKITVEEYVRRIMADPKYDWKQLINFYGRVVDESNAAVSGASIHFTWNDISEKGTAEADTTSDSNGGFLLNDQHGKRLYVDVGKSGYYSSGNSRGAAFEYANPADGLFTPDAGNPVVFHLRKKGIGVDLITSQYGISTDFQIHIPRDGTPIKVDFLQRKTGDSGQMQITENKPAFSSWKSATNWWFRLEIPDGGFVEETDEFPFEAPETGYQSSIEYSFQQNQPDLIINLKKDYYIKFGNPPRYGRLHLETGISYGGAILIYAINPDGSRNLEQK